MHNNKGNQFQFNFEISLHKDDIGAINHIYNSLGIGKVYIKKNRATFIVRSLDEIKIILEIFSQNPLNTTKHLNFLDFKRAYLIYINKDSSRGELKEIVANIKSQMNVNRTLLLTDIALLINKGSNYMILDGKTYIKSLNRFLSTNKKVAVQLIAEDSGVILKTFDSVSECAKFLDINIQTAHYRTKKNSNFYCSSFNQTVYIKKIED